MAESGHISRSYQSLYDVWVHDVRYLLVDVRGGIVDCVRNREWWSCFWCGWMQLSEARSYLGLIQINDMLGGLMTACFTCTSKICRHGGVQREFKAKGGSEAAGRQATIIGRSYFQATCLPL